MGLGALTRGRGCAKVPTRLGEAGMLCDSLGAASASPTKIKTPYLYLFHKLCLLLSRALAFMASARVMLRSLSHFVSWAMAETGCVLNDHSLRILRAYVCGIGKAPTKACSGSFGRHQALASRIEA